MTRTYTFICIICHAATLESHPNKDKAYEGWLKCPICAYTVFNAPNEIPAKEIEIIKPLPVRKNTI